MKKEREFKLPEENNMQHKARAKREARVNGGIKNIKRTKSGTMINYNNGTGYWLGK